MADLGPLFPIGARVALRNDCADIYPKVFGGSEGIIKDYKIDKDGFHKVYVDWDKENDWRYQGASDGWTFAEHFVMKEDPQSEPLAKTPKPRRITKKDIEAAKILDVYIDEIQKGMEALSDSEGFLLFIAKRIPVDGNPDQIMVVPELYGASHTRDADAVLGMAMAEHMTTTFQDMTILFLEMFGGEDA